MTEVVQARQNKPENAMKKAKLFHPGGRISPTKPMVL
jgi:hypothetical protein